MLFLLISIELLSQDLNKIILGEYSEPMLIGYCTREAFNDSSFAKWFYPEYDNYKTDSSAIDLLKEKLNGIECIVIMGTWCDDSRIHIPHLYKILDEINYPAKGITLIAVDEDKKAEGGEVEALDLYFVPTIIFFKDGSEIGRIIEMPNQSIEEDMLEIISQEVL
ncbi:MAG: thiol reductase thioredoxin [Ignavibacteriales bacterium]|nr:MAG: thiol reductase thioredoxin [Ignavibacteriales bacterium]